MEKFCLVADCEPPVDLVGCVFYIPNSRSYLAFGARRICHSFSSWVHVGGLRVQPVRSCCSQVKRGR